jgi:DNA topoisomerase-6 subunit B
MSTFEESSDVAQELADNQREISIAEFFEQNKQMLGFGSKTRALVTAAKEGVDNSLDAAEEANILPDISINITEHEQYYILIIEDNGPGLPRSNIPNVFGKLLYGSRFHSRSQTRGQQGIGISAAVLYSQLTSGNPARVTSKTKEDDTAHYVEVGIDTDTNEPKIYEEKEVDWPDKEHGIRIEMDMEGNMRARKRLHQYVHETAVVNPHATIELHEPKHDLVYDDRPVTELPDPVEEIKPHPHGVELGTLQYMLAETKCQQLNSFFKTDFTRVGQKTADSILNNFRDMNYGRSLGWPVVTKRTSKEDYRDAFFGAVRRKGQEATDTFFEYVFDDITRESLVTYEGLQSAVTNGADKAGEETIMKFGQTVRDNAIDALWDVLKKNLVAHTIESVDEVTIDRKNQMLVAHVGKELSNQFIKHGSKQITYNELKKSIEIASDNASKTMNGEATFGETAQEKVLELFWSQSETVSTKVPLVREVAEDRDLASNLLAGMQKANAMAPPTKCLSPITEDDILTGLKTRYDAEFYTATTRSASVAKGEPFVIEAGIAYGGSIETGGNKIQLSRFANRVPLVYQEGACAITQVVKGIRWNSYYTSRDKISQHKGSLPQGPMVLLVHVASTNVPFTSESKDAVASVPEIEDEVERAVRDVARDLKKYMGEQRSKQKRKQKQDVIGGLLRAMSDKLENITSEEISGKANSQARILNNVYVENAGDGIVNVTNYRGKKEDVVITGTLDSISDDMPDDVEISDNNTFECVIPVSKEETKSISFGSDITDLDITKPEKQKVTISD